MFDENSVRALLLALFAGLSTLIGALSILFISGRSKSFISLALGFAAGVMISAAFTDLFPESEELLNGFFGEGRGIVISVLCLICGIVIAAAMDKLLPHSHGGHDDLDDSHNLMRVGTATAIAIALHNLPEGIAIYMAGYESTTLGVTIALAVSLHNLPGGISIASPIYYASGSKKTALKYAFLAGMAEPLGALIACLLLRPFINDAVIGVMFGIVAGILLYIGFEELLPAARRQSHNNRELIALFAGICFMPLTHIFHAH